MNVTSQLAKHLREVCFGENWTDVNLKDTLAGVTWQQATTKVHSINTIVALVYHIHYYVDAIAKVLQGGPLQSSDKYAFDHPKIESEQDWQLMLDKFWKGAEMLEGLIDQLPESTLWETFTDEKYGNYYRNLQGVTEHAHYHLGQIVLLKKHLIPAA